MKKILILVMLSFILVGCGCSKKDNNNNENVLNSDIGKKDVTYTLEVACGDKSANSKVFLSKDKDASYELYECNNNNLRLITGSGTYKYSDDIVTLIDEYDQELELKVTEDSLEVDVLGNVQNLVKNN